MGKSVNNLCTFHGGGRKYVWAFYNTRWNLFFYKAFVKSKQKTVLSFFLAALLIGVLFLKTNLANIVFATIRYLLEQSSINDIAHSIAWQLPKDINLAVTSGYFWQFVRFSWLLLIIPVLYFLFREEAIKTNNSEKELRWLFLISVLILCVLLIPRAAGRIDPDIYSRPGWISVGFVISVLPMLFVPEFKKSNFKISTILLIALIFGLIGNQESKLKSTWNLGEHILYQPTTTFTGTDYNLSNVGSNVFIDSSLLTTQVNIHNVLKQVLLSEETYYDATNQTSNYGFQGKPSPVVDVAFYNTPSKAQQLRAVSSLENSHVPLALIYSNNKPHDGGPLSLRSFYIYQYLIRNFLPFEDNAGQIWMIRKGEEVRLAQTEYSIGNATEQMLLLQRAFFQNNLWGLPASWGKSIDSLQTELAKPTVLFQDKQNNVEQNNFFINSSNEETDNNKYFVEIEFPVQTKGDILLLEFNEKLSNGHIQIYWKNTLVQEYSPEHSFLFDLGSSVFLIPISSAPSWSEANQAQSIRIAITLDGEYPIKLKKLYFIKGM